MKYLIAILILVFVLFSGCIFLFLDNNKPTNPGPISIYINADMKRVYSGEVTYLYLIFDNLQKKEKYTVDAKIENPGLFKVVSSPKSEDLEALQRKTLEFKLRALEVPSETTSTVSVDVRIAKSTDFYFPILFAKHDYLVKKEVEGIPVSKRQKNYVLSDGIINVYIKLNKNPPIESGVVYGNIKVAPIGEGIIDLLHISVDGKPCEVDDYTNSGSCSFSAAPKTLIEKKFDIQVNYRYRVTKRVSFTILPQPSGIVRCGSKCVSRESCRWRKTNEPGITCTEDYCGGKKPGRLYVCRCDEVKCP